MWAREIGTIAGHHCSPRGQPSHNKVKSNTLLGPFRGHSFSLPAWQLMQQGITREVSQEGRSEDHPRVSKLPYWVLAWREIVLAILRSCSQTPSSDPLTHGVAQLVPVIRRIHEYTTRATNQILLTLTRTKRSEKNQQDGSFWRRGQQFGCADIIYFSVTAGAAAHNKTEGTGVQSPLQHSGALEKECRRRSVCG